MVKYKRKQAKEVNNINNACETVKGLEMANNNNNLSLQAMLDASEEVTKNGDWVLPVIDKKGNQLLVTQINKTQEEKDNFATIFAEYQEAGIKIHRYAGKNNTTVFAVEQGSKIKKARVGVKKQALINKLVDEKGFTLEEATAFANSLK